MSATFLKFGEYNLFPSISTLLFIHCSEFNFKESHLQSDLHYKHCKFEADMSIYPDILQHVEPCIFLHITDCVCC